MKTKNILHTLLAALCCLTSVSCMDGDWESPQFEESPYGNNEIDTTTYISIAQLKKMYPAYAANYTCTEMKQDAKLRVYVTGNDIQGNLYNSIAVQDEAGDALIISISESGLYGYLPVGQWIIIDTKGLYIGGYGSQPQIGYPYTNSSGSTYVSRMSSSLWQKHFRILHQKKTDIEIPSYTATQLAALDMATYCGRLMTITGVQVDGADGKTKTWASESDAGSQTSVTLYIKGTKLEIYTSTYCDFANAVIPNKKMNLTGIWKRYNNYWELILRSEKDIQVIE